MVKLLQNLDLAYGSNRELRRDNHILIIGGETKREEKEGAREVEAKQTYALPLVVHADLLERHDFLRLHLLRHEYLPGSNQNKKRISGGRPAGPMRRRRLAGLGNRGSFERCVPVGALPDLLELLEAVDAAASGATGTPISTGVSS